MPTDNSFADVMARLRAGDDGAAAEVVRRFTHRLVALARAHLGSRLRQKVDPEDVLQSAYGSFFTRLAAGRLDLGGWDGLWALLWLITARKGGRYAERFGAARRDVRAEAPGGDLGVTEALSAQPSPAEAAMLSELIEQLLRELGERDGRIRALALWRHSAAETSERLGRPSRAVYRVLERVKARLRAAPVDPAPLTAEATRLLPFHRGAPPCPPPTPSPACRSTACRPRSGSGWRGCCSNSRTPGAPADGRRWTTSCRRRGRSGGRC